MQTIEYYGKTFPSKTLNIPGYGTETISVESLLDQLIDEDGNLVNDTATKIDEGIFFYVDDDRFTRLDDKMLAAYVALVV